MTTSLRLRWQNEQTPPAAPRPLLNALTIDVEDYYHVTGFEGCVSRRQWDDFSPRVGDSTRHLLDRLDEAGVQATFFILGWVAERQPDLICTIRAAGHEIGCHSYAHRLIYEQTPREFRLDLRQGAASAGRHPRRTSHGLPRAEFLDRRKLALGLGHFVGRGLRLRFEHLSDASRSLRHRGHAALPHRIERHGGSLWEFPPPVWRLMKYPLPIGGGGYFRLYPYGLTRRGLRAINAAGRPFAVYLHPWEFDPEQPRLRPGRLRAFRHYVG